MSSKIDFSQAKADHLAWKFRVRNFLDGKETLEKNEMISHFHCRMGKWFYSEGKEEFGHLDTIKKFELKHVKAHKLAKDILELKTLGDTELAEELYDDLVVTSESILDLLTESENILNKDIVDEVVEVENIDKIVAWDKSLTIMCKMDPKGIIEYVNNVFTDVSGYESAEVTGKSITHQRHPDMPQVIYKMLWDRLNKGETIPVIAKNLSKSGKYYWVITDFKINKNADNNEVLSIIAKQKGLDMKIVRRFIEPLYANLLSIENTRDIKASEKFLEGFLEERNRTYAEYVESLMMTGRDTVKKTTQGFFSRLFGFKK